MFFKVWVFGFFFFGDSFIWFGDLGSVMGVIFIM